MNIQNIVDNITDTFSLDKVSADPKGIYHFILDRDIDIDLFSPNNKISIFLGKLYDIDSDHTLANTIITYCAKFAITVCKKKKSVLSIEDKFIALYLIVQNDSPDLFPEYMKMFAYDMDWWKQTLDQYSSPVNTFSQPYGSGIVMP